jgi:hypothetical protein
MAAQLYANTQLALALYEVLQELVEEGKVPEQLAVATLAQVRLAATLGGMQQLLLGATGLLCLQCVPCRMQLGSRSRFASAHCIHCIEYQAAMQQYDCSMQHMHSAQYTNTQPALRTCVEACSVVRDASGSRSTISQCVVAG